MVQVKRAERESSTDVETILRVRSGQREEFGVLVERYQSTVRTLIYRQVQNQSLADELAQETFVRAYTGLEGFKGTSAFPTWLTRIALNVTKNYFTSRRYKEQRVNIPYEPALHENLLTKNDGEHSSEELAIIAHALGDLPAKQREPLTLVFLEGKSYQEAAEILEIPLGTLSSRITKGIALLRAHLTGGKV